MLAFQWNHKSVHARHRAPSPWLFPGIGHRQLTIRGAAWELWLPGLRSSEVLGSLFLQEKQLLTFGFLCQSWPWCWIEVFWDDHVCLHQQLQHNPYKSHLVGWTSHVPASHHSYLCGYSLITPFSTSAWPGLNLGKQLNFNSLNLFWGPQNLLLKLGETLCQPQMSENFLWLHPVVSAGFAIKFVS